MNLQTEPLNMSVVVKITAMIIRCRVVNLSTLTVRRGVDIIEFLENLDCSGRELLFIFNCLSEDTTDKITSEYLRTLAITSFPGIPEFKFKDHTVILGILNYVFPKNNIDDIVTCVENHFLTTKMSLANYVGDYDGDPVFRKEASRPPKDEFFTEFTIPIVGRKMSNIHNLLNDAIRFAKTNKVSVTFDFNGWTFDISPIADYDKHMDEYSKFVENKSNFQ